MGACGGKSGVSEPSTTDKFLAKYCADGEMPASKLKEFLTEAFGEQNVSDDEIELLMKELDLDSNGMIGPNEMRAFLRCYDPRTKHINTKTALVVVDVQNDFISGTLANPFNAAEIVPKINDLRKKFDVVVISYDWHPHDHCSFVETANDGKTAMTTEKKEFSAFETITLKTDKDRPAHEQVLYPRHAVQNSDGGKAHQDLELSEKDIVIYKGTKPNIDSYSAFFDNKKANATGLAEKLETEGVTHLFCCGLVLDICVMATALHGAELGYKVSVVEEACKPLSEEGAENAKRSLAAGGCAVLSCMEAMEAADTISGQKELSLKDYMKSIQPSRKASAVVDSVERSTSSHTAKI
jgi:nicotinamidase-related amidase